MTIKDFFNKILSIFKSDAFKKDLQLVAEWTPKVLPYVESATKFTATATDDEIVAWVKSHVPDIQTAADGWTPDTINSLIAMAVRAIVKLAFPGISIPDRIIDTAIQMAYVAVRRGASGQ